jgi:hypothetical protein
MASTTGSPRSIDDIERDLAASRTRLAENISSLINEAHPKAVVHRTVEDVKQVARQQTEHLAEQAREQTTRLTDQARQRGGQLKDLAQSGVAWVEGRLRDDNGWRTERLIGVAGGLLGVLTFIGVARHGRR